MPTGVTHIREGECHSTSKNALDARTIAEAVEIILAGLGEGGELDERVPHSLDWIVELSQLCLWSTYFR